MHHLNKLISKELVVGLPKLKFEKDHICEACQKGKQIEHSFKLKNIVSTSKPLELLHIYLFGPSRTPSLGGNYYALVIVDDYSRFTWTLLSEAKSDVFSAFKKLAKRLQNACCSNICAICSDHGGEFPNEKFSSFCEKYEIFHHFSAPRTPQQNGVAERKYRSLEELARTMLSESSFPKYFWVDVVCTACYVINRVLIRPILKKTPYELFHRRKSNICHFKVFGCKCYILNNGKENLGKFEEKADNGIFLGYSLTSHAYCVYNKRLMTVEESVHIVFYESNHVAQESRKNFAEDDEQIISIEKLESCPEKQSIESANQPIEILQQCDLPKEWRILRDLSVDNIIGQIQKGVSTRNFVSNLCKHMAFLSQIEPKSVGEALKDESWIVAMQDELNQFTKSEVWTLVPQSDCMNVIGTRWIYRNKLDEAGVITRNNGRLVAKGYNQEEGIDYDETFTLVARLEVVRPLLAFACMSGFKLFQMDVKSAFLNGFINEEVYVSQPPGFEDHQHPNHVCKLKKALYGLKQTPRQWYERLSNFLLSHNYERGKIDKSIFIKKSKFAIILVQIYVVDIIVGAINDCLCEEFLAAMQGEFEMSMMGELSFFLGLQIR